MKRTKIVATIGPASESKSTIEKMIKAGLNVARLNFSHGSYKNHQLLINNLRAVAAKLQQPLAIMQDLQGPRIRTGAVAQAGIKIKIGEEIILAPEKYQVAKTKLKVIPTQYQNLYQDVVRGKLILIEDGTIELRVLKISGRAVHCQVKAGSLIKSHKGMNFPGSTISTPAITAKDKQDLKFGLGHKVDFVALSFVKDANDIKQLRRLIAAAEKRRGYQFKNFESLKKDSSDLITETKIIAKIERPEAVAHFEEILQAADGIMVARGDLGLEIPIQDLPLIQKHIIQRCTQVGKPVIVATQMLDSMIRNPVPTRAEVSDVANAILDGTDAIMLSGETATGLYPLKAVAIMKKIANRLEATEIDSFEQLEQVLKRINDTASSVSFSAQDIAEDIGAKLIVCLTVSGFTARSLARFRPEVPVVALTPSVKILNQLALSWGVRSYPLSFTTSLEQLLSRIKKLLLAKKLLARGDKFVLVASHPLRYSQRANLVTVETV